MNVVYVKINLDTYLYIFVCDNNKAPQYDEAISYKILRGIRKIHLVWFS